MEKQQSMKQQLLLRQEWDSLIDDFSSGDPSRRDRWLHLPLLELALSTLLFRDFPTSLKLSLILFIEESHSFLASPPSAALAPLLDALRALLALPSAADPHALLFRDQFMTMTTSVAISVLDAPPLDSVSGPMLDSLVELLLTVVNRPNHGPDRQSRAFACECLRELETAFPCLLSDAAGHLWTLAQAERTHAAQSYLLLLATVIHNIVLGGLLSSATSFLATSITLVPFNAPWHLFEDPPQRIDEPSDLNLKEIKRVTAFLWEGPQALTPPATMELVSILSDIAGALEQQVPTMGTLLKVQFSGLISSYDPILCHAVLMLCSRFPDAFVGHDGRSIIQRLALMAKDANQPLVFRLLALHWIISSSQLGNEETRMFLTPFFFPSVFDPLAVKAKKLDVLASIAANMDVPVGEKKGIEEDEDQKEQILKLLIDGLACVSSFKWLPPWSSETAVAFRTLHKFLIGASPHNSDVSGKSGVDFLIDSFIFRMLQSKMVNLALEHQILVPVIAAFVDRLLRCEAHYLLGDLLLQNLDEHLLSKLDLNYGVSSYFPLFERIAKSNTIPPRGLLRLLSRHVVSVMKRHSPDTWLSSWSQGTKVLGICRMMLKHHHSSRVFLPLSNLLALMCESFPDLDVRDNARIYLRMLICIPGEKLKHILTIGEQPSVLSPSHPGSLFQIASPGHLEGMKNPGWVSSYVFLERVTPLLVKQSWALVLPEPSIRDDGGASYAVDASNIRASSSVSAGGEDEVNYKKISLPLEPLRVMDSEDAEILAVLREHFSFIPDFRHMLGIKIKIPCVLRFDAEQFNHVIGTSSSTSASEELDASPALYATTINFSSTAKYGSIPPCRVPFLLGEPSKDKYAIVTVSGSSEEYSNHRASVILVLEPRQPMPGIVDVNIKTNADDGQLISGKLQSIPVGIEDMFLKVIVPPVVNEDEKPKYYFNLFHALWEACGNSEITGRETFSLNGAKGFAAIYGTQSVKLLEISHHSLVGTVEKHLSSFVVGVIGSPLIDAMKDNGIIKDVVWDDNVDDFHFAAHDAGALVPYSDKGPLQLPYFEVPHDTKNLPLTIKKDMGTILLLIFLPPRFHLLLQMEVSKLSTLVRIRTDHWPCLGYIDEYLETLFFT